MRFDTPTPVQGIAVNTALSLGIREFLRIRFGDFESGAFNGLCQPSFTTVSLEWTAGLEECIRDQAVEVGSICTAQWGRPFVVSVGQDDAGEGVAGCGGGRQRPACLTGDIATAPIESLPENELDGCTKFAYISKDGIKLELRRSLQIVRMKIIDFRTNNRIERYKRHSQIPSQGMAERNVRFGRCRLKNSF